MKILIVEDDSATVELISYKLKDEGFDVISSETVLDSLEKIEKMKPKIIILDLHLQDGEGMAICKMIRENSEKYNNPVILIITQRTEKEDVIRGLSDGADDYIKKPFDIDEFILKVKVWAKRVNPEIGSGELKYKDIYVNLTYKSVSVKGEELLFTKKEYELLAYFIKNQGLVLSRSRIMMNLWNKDYIFGDRCIDTYVKNLRKRIASLSDSIITIQGFGYKLKLQTK